MSPRRPSQNRSVSCLTALRLSLGLTGWLGGLSLWAAVLTKLGLIRLVLETFLTKYYKRNLREMGLRSTVLFNDIPELASIVNILVRPVVGSPRNPLSATNASILLQFFQVVLNSTPNCIRILLLRVGILLYDKVSQLRRGPFC